jgi:hypothetical protein
MQRSDYIKQKSDYIKLKLITLNKKWLHYAIVFFTSKDEQWVRDWNEDGGDGEKNDEQFHGMHCEDFFLFFSEKIQLLLFITKKATFNEILLFSRVRWTLKDSKGKLSCVYEKKGPKSGENKAYKTKNEENVHFNFCFVLRNEKYLGLLIVIIRPW